MQLLGLIDEDFVNYKLPSMTLMFPKCSMKCNHEAGCEVCHNSGLLGSQLVDIPYSDLCERYLQNPLTKSVVCQGLEPFDSPQELYKFIYTLRKIYKCNDPIVIYSGYKENEIDFSSYTQFGNIVIKFGRFIPKQESHYDEILGVKLASPNQYAKEFK